MSKAADPSRRMPDPVIVRTVHFPVDVYTEIDDFRAANAMKSWNRALLTMLAERRILVMQAKGIR